MSYYAFCIQILSSIRFNKAQLVFTVPGLLAAIVVTILIYNVSLCMRV